MKNNQSLGRKGESIAADYLLGMAWEILETNWRYSRSEIDIIALDGDVLVFVEVKTKSSDHYLPPESTVNSVKQKRIVDAANRYMDKTGMDREIRFDVISIVDHGEAGHTLTHFADAFFPGLEP